MFYNYYCGTVSATNDSICSNDDIQISQNIVDTDPITKQPLQNPCRNIICKHVYGMDSIKASLQANPMLRCPIGGCSNKKHIKLNDLRLDKDLARKLEVQRAKNSAH